MPHIFWTIALKLAQTTISICVWCDQIPVPPLPKMIFGQHQDSFVPFCSQWPITFCDKIEPYLFREAPGPFPSPLQKDLSDLGKTWKIPSPFKDPVIWGFSSCCCMVAFESTCNTPSAGDWEGLGIIHEKPCKFSTQGRHLPSHHQSERWRERHWDWQFSPWSRFDSKTLGLSFEAVCQQQLQANESDWYLHSQWGGWQGQASESYSKLLNVDVQSARLASNRIYFMIGWWLPEAKTTQMSRSWGTRKKWHLFRRQLRKWCRLLLQRHLIVVSFFVKKNPGKTGGKEWRSWRNAMIIQEFRHEGHLMSLANVVKKLSSYQKSNK